VKSVESVLRLEGSLWGKDDHDESGRCEGGQYGLASVLTDGVRTDLSGEDHVGHQSIDVDQFRGGRLVSRGDTRQRITRTRLYTHHRHHMPLGTGVPSGVYNIGICTLKIDKRCVFQELPEPNRACLVGVW